MATIVNHVDRIDVDTKNGYVFVTQFRSTGEDDDVLCFPFEIAEMVASAILECACQGNSG